MPLNVNQYNLWGENDALEAISEIVSDSLSLADSVDDKSIRNLLVNANGFSSCAAISKNAPGPCAIHLESGVTVFLVIGTNDQMFKRIASAYHDASDNGLIFVVQSDSEAWWRENQNKIQRSGSDGNRSAFGKFSNIIEAFSGWNDWSDSAIALEISRPVSDNNYQRFMRSIGRLE